MENGAAWREGATDLESEVSQVCNGGVVNGREGMTEGRRDRRSRAFSGARGAACRTKSKLVCR